MIDNVKRLTMNGFILGMFLFCLALPARAVDVSIRVTDKEDLQSALEGGSLLLEADEESDAEGEKNELTVQEIVANAQADYRRFLAILYDSGYFEPYISIKIDGREAAVMDATSAPSSIQRIDVVITAGRQFRFGTVAVEPVSPSIQLPKEFQRGETASLTALRGAARAGVAGWRNDGHAKAQVSGQKVTANHRSGEIDAEINVTPGPKVTFGPLSVSGNVDVRTERILAIAGLPEGEVFSPKELQDSADRLRRAGAFRSVTMVEPDTPENDNSYPITARVVEQTPRRIGFGGEIGTTEGLTLRGYWFHRNVLGGAENLRFDAEISGIEGDTGGTDYKLGTTFERPATFDRDTTFIGLARLERLERSGYTTDQATVGAEIERRVSDNRTDRFGLGLRYAETSDGFGDSDYTLLLFRAATTLDFRDFEFDARRGYYAHLSATPFLAVSGSDNGVWTELDYRRYFSFGQERSTTLALRGQLGSVAGPSIEDAPVDFLFYSGGSGTVRGHEFENLGIGEDDDGDIIGGRSFVGLSSELRFRTSGALGYVAFFDAGYVGEESYPDGSGEWQSGAGVGIRYATGIGPVRVDFAVPTSGDDNGSDFQLYIGIGQAF